MKTSLEGRREERTNDRQLGGHGDGGDTDRAHPVSSSTTCVLCWCWSGGMMTQPRSRMVGVGGSWEKRSKAAQLPLARSGVERAERSESATHPREPPS